MARRTLHIVGDVVATLKLGGQVVKVAKPSIHAAFRASTLFSGSWTSGNGGHGIFNSSEGGRDGNGKTSSNDSGGAGADYNPAGTRTADCNRDDSRQHQTDFLTT